MIKINEKAKKIIKNLNNNFYIVSDFDRTITVGSSYTSWSILANTNLVCQEYIDERNNLYNYYRPIEISHDIPFEEKNRLVYEWFQKHLNLFIKYKLREDIFKTAISDKNIMSFREGAKDYLKFLHKNNIPLIIISAGIGNFIEQFLILNDCHYNNIFIESNYIKFKDGIANQVSKNIIHSLNKNEYSCDPKIKNMIKGKKYIILFGDQIEDIKMVDPQKDKYTIKIGFLLNPKDKKIFEENFDIVVDDNESYINILKELSLL